MSRFQEILQFTVFKYNEYHLDIIDLFQAALILVAVKGMVALFGYSLKRRVASQKLDFGSAKSIHQMLKYVLWVIAIMLCLQSLGVNISLMLAGSAALLVGIGLGLQQTFNDFFSGIVLLMDRSIKAGDVVEVDNMVCTVVTIGLRTSNLLTRDNISLIVPNSKLTANTVTNWTAESEVSRFVVRTGVSYSSDVRLVEKLMLEAAKDHPDIVADPSPFVRFTDFGESSLDFELFFWSARAFRIENVKSDLRYAIIAKFREHKVEIPFPQRDLHIRSGYKSE